MLRDIAEKYYFSEDYNCAEAIIRAANEYYNLNIEPHDLIMVAGFGAGIQCGSTCGALLSMSAVLSLKYVKSRAHASPLIKPLTLKIFKQFKETFGDTLCKEIKPNNFEPDQRCFKVVAQACDILEKTISDFEAIK